MASQKTTMLAGTGRIIGHVAHERITRPRPTSPPAVPASVDALTLDWLTVALGGGSPGARLIGMTPAGGSDGSTSRRQIALRWNDAGRTAGLPELVFSKSTPRITSRLIAGLSGAVAAECGFYTQLRPGLDIESPVAYHASHDPASHRSMILLEDVGVTRGATFGDPTTLEITRPLAESMVDQLATYHAAYWGDRALDGYPWLPTSREFQLQVNAMINFEKRSSIGIDRAADVIPAGLLARRSEIWPTIMSSLELNVRGPRTLLHSDVHLGNWYVTADGRMGQYDWQCATRGGWALDVAYALLSGLTIEDRRAWERDLLDRYVDRLAALGVTPERGLPTEKEAWTQYRQQTWHAFVFWIYTIGAGRLQPAMQPEHVSRANIARMAAAIDDLESLDAVQHA